MSLEYRVMQYVGDKKSKLFGNLVYIDMNAGWLDHLSRPVEKDFSVHYLFLREEIKIPRKKLDSAGLDEVLKNNACQGFFHFTDITNLPSILTKGYLASRNLADKQQLIHLDAGESIDDSLYLDHLVSAEHKLRVRDFARFTIQSNNPILYKYQGIIPGTCVPQPCIFTVSPDIVLIEGVVFSRTNANASRQIYDGSAGFLKEIPIQKLQNERGCSTYERGAEVLYPIAAPINFVTGISFRSYAELKQALHLTKSLPYQNIMKKQRELFPCSKGEIYLNEVWISNKEETDFGMVIATNKDDEKQIPFDTPTLFFNYKMSYFKEEYKPAIKIKIFHEGKQRNEITRDLKRNNKWDIKSAIKERGNYEVKVTIIRENKEEPNIYVSEFNVV